MKELFAGNIILICEVKRHAYTKMSNVRIIVILVDIRKTFDERTKQEHLDKLKKVIAEDTPAVFLYNPTHYYVMSESVNNVQLGKLSNHADRFNDLVNWYIKEDYLLKEEFSLKMLFRWIFSF